MCTYMTVEMKDLTCAIIFETRGTYWLRRDPTYPEWDLEENMFTIIVQLKYSRPSSPSQWDTLRFFSDVAPLGFSETQSCPCSDGPTSSSAKISTGPGVPWQSCKFQYIKMTLKKEIHPSITKTIQPLQRVNLLTQLEEVRGSCIQGDPFPELLATHRNQHYIVEPIESIELCFP